MKRKWYCCQIFLFRITDFVLMLHSLMFEVTYNVVLLVLVFLFPWKGKCCNTDVRLLAWWGEKKKTCTLNIFIWKYPVCLYCVLCWHPVWLKVWKVVLEKKEEKLHDDKHQLLQQMTSTMHRSVARIIFWLHDHMPRAHNSHVMYNFEHHSSQVAAEWGVCVVIADVHHTAKNVCFSTIVQKLLTLFSPFTQTWLTIWPSKKYKSHTNINVKKFNPFCPLSLHTFWHLVFSINRHGKNCSKKNKNN